MQNTSDIDHLTSWKVMKSSYSCSFMSLSLVASDLSSENSYSRFVRKSSVWENDFKAPSLDLLIL